MHKRRSGGTACLSELQQNDLDGLRALAGETDTVIGVVERGLAVAAQKTDVAEWLGVQGRSAWPGEALPPEGLRTNVLVEMVETRKCTSVQSSLTRLSRSLVLALAALLQAIGHVDLHQILNVLHAGLLVKSHKGTVEEQPRYGAAFRFSFWFTCDSEKHSSSEFLNPSGASMRMSRLPASSSSLQGDREDRGEPLSRR